MNKVVTILLFVAFLTGTARSGAIHITLQNLHTQQKNRGSDVIHQSRKSNLTLLFETKSTNPAGPGPVEEEAEDEDSTGKEDIYHKMTSFHLSLFLQQLYGRMNALFKEHHREVESPPPKFIARGPQF